MSDHPISPRITITSRADDGFLEIWMNEAGRDLLVRELLGLDEKWDHFHLDPNETAIDVPIRAIAYRDGDVVHTWGKVMLRPDAWDAEHFPHVLTPKKP
jgi:hypothetical protein